MILNLWKFFKQLKVWANALRFALLRAFFLLLILILNPFGVVDRSAETSRDVWQNIYAEGYLEASREPGDPIGDDPKGRRDISVVLIDQQSLDSMAASGGIDPFDVADMIDRIIAASHAKSPKALPPKAIFVDLSLGSLAPPDADAEALTTIGDAERETCLLGPVANPQSAFRCLLAYVGSKAKFDRWGNDSACQQSQLAKLDCINRAGGIPIIFADPRSEGGSEGQTAAEGYAALGRVGILSPVRYESVNKYSLVHPESQDSRENSTYEIFPAALLFAIYCQERPGVQNNKLNRHCAESPVVPPSLSPSAASWRQSYWGWSDRFERPLDVIWGIGAESPFTEERVGLSEGDYEVLCKPAIGTGGEFLTLVRLLFSGVNFQEKGRCNHSRILLYHQLGGASERLLDMAFSDRLVMIGQSSEAADDFIETVPVGRVPGVLWHAMATDNLIVAQQQYQKTPKEIFFFTMTDSDLWNLLALAILFVPLGAAHQYSKHENDLLSKKRVTLKYSIVARLWVLFLFLTTAAVIVQIFTGQSKPIPQQYDYAALTLVFLFEIFRLGAVLLEPFTRLATDRWSVFKQMFDRS